MARRITRRSKNKKLRTRRRYRLKQRGGTIITKMIYVHDMSADNCQTIPGGDDIFKSWATFKLELGDKADLSEAYKQLTDAISREYQNASIFDKVVVGGRYSEQDWKKQQQMLAREQKIAAEQARQEQLKLKSTPTPQQLARRRAAIEKEQKESEKIEVIPKHVGLLKAKSAVPIKFYTACKEYTSMDAVETFTLEYFKEMIPKPIPINIYVI